MTDGPQQRFRGLIHLPPKSEGDSARMAIQFSELPDVSGADSWKGARSQSHRGLARVLGKRDIYKSTALGKMYVGLTESPVPTHPGDSDLSSLAFSVDDYTSHFGMHPEEHLRKITQNHTRAARNERPTQRVTNRAAATADPEPQAPAPEPEPAVPTAPTRRPSGTPRPPKSAPATRPAPRVTPPQAPAAPVGRGLTCPHCNASSPDAPNTDAGMVFISKHMNRQCYD